MDKKTSLFLERRSIRKYKPEEVKKRCFLWCSGSGSGYGRQPGGYLGGGWFSCHRKHVKCRLCTGAWLLLDPLGETGDGDSFWTGAV